MPSIVFVDIHPRNILRFICATITSALTMMLRVSSFLSLHLSPLRKARTNCQAIVPNVLVTPIVEPEKQASLRTWQLQREL